MFIKAAKNILIKGQHVEAGSIVETDASTAQALIAGKLAKAAEKPKPAPKKRQPKAKKEPPVEVPED